MIDHGFYPLSNKIKEKQTPGQSTDWVFFLSLSAEPLCADVDKGTPAAQSGLQVLLNLRSVFVRKELFLVCVTSFKSYLNVWGEHCYNKTRR